MKPKHTRFGYMLAFVLVLTWAVNAVTRADQAQVEARTYLPLLRENAAAPPSQFDSRAYLPLAQADPLPPTLPAAALYSSETPVDYAATAADLAANNQQLAFAKIGFHAGPGGNSQGLDAWMASLDAAGVPFFLKSVDDPSYVVAATELVQSSGVPHTLVFRKTGLGYDFPNYDLPPAVAAQLHWQNHMAALPAELDPTVVWLETVNEVDKGRSEWLAEFSIETAQLALAAGYRWAAFGWSSGEPEPEHWYGPKMLEFLALAGQHPDQIAIALHEYSYSDEIGNIYPYLVGRFQHLFDIVDRYDIPRPTVLITEWGWQNRSVPPVTDAMADIAWASWLYANYPEVRGAALWYLGTGYNGIADQAQQLIAPLGTYALTHYFGRVPGQGMVNTDLFLP